MAPMKSCSLRGEARLEVGATEVGNGHEGEANEQSWNDPGQKEGANGLFSRNPVNYHRDAWRNYRTHGGGGGCDGGRKAEVISFLFHGGDEDRTDGRGVSHCCPSDTRKKHACHHNKSETTPHMADEQVGEVNQTSSDTATVHQSTSQNKERDSQQGKRVGSLEHHMWEQQQGGISNLHEACQGTDTYAEGNGSSQNQQDDETDGDANQLLLPVLRATRHEKGPSVLPKHVPA